MKNLSNFLPSIHNSRFILVFCLTLIVVVLDHLFKIIAGNFMEVVCNANGPFGLPTGGVIVYVFVLILVACAMYMEKRRKALFGLALIFAGGATNIIDRLIFGCVRDFIKVFSLPVFNFADVSITLGVLILVIVLVKYKND